MQPEVVLLKLPTVFRANHSRQECRTRVGGIEDSVIFCKIYGKNSIKCLVKISDS